MMSGSNQDISGQNGNKKSGRTNIVLTSTAPVADGGRKYNILYVIFAVAGVVFGMISGGDAGAATLAFFIAIFLCWVIKNLICYFPLQSMRAWTFHCDRMVSYDQMIQELQPVLVPMGMTIEKSSGGTPVITYRNVIYDINYYSADTFGIWWRKSPLGAFLTTNLYIPLYRKACVAYGIIGYSIQQICRNPETGGQYSGQWTGGSMAGAQIPPDAGTSYAGPQNHAQTDPFRAQTEGSPSGGGQPRRKKGLIAVLVIIAVLLLIIIVFAALGGEGEDTSETAAVSSENITESSEQVKDSSAAADGSDEDVSAESDYVRPDVKTDATPEVEDEFSEYASYLPGTYKVLGTITASSDSIMPLSESQKLLSGSRLTEEGERQVEGQTDFSFVITSDGQYTLVDYDGTTSSGTITVSDNQIYLDGTAKFNIYTDGSLSEDTDYGQTLVLVKDYLVEEETNQILDEAANADNGTDESEEDCGSETVMIGGTEFVVGDTISCDLMMPLEVATADDTYYGTIMSFDQQTSYVTVEFLNGLSDITCDNNEALYPGTDLEVFEVYISGIADATADVPVIYGQITSSHVLVG